MKRISAIIVIALLACSSAFGAVIYEGTSPYHHIRVVEERDLRTLCFDDAMESRCPRRRSRRSIRSRAG